MWSDYDKGRWAINFDLDTKKTEEFHPSHTRQGAYDELKKFFIDNGFLHCQNSGYASKEEMETAEIKHLVRSLVLQAPYVKEYVRKMDATIIKPEYIYDCTELFNDDEEVVKYTGELENFIPQPKVEEKPEEIAHDLKLVLMKNEDELQQNELLNKEIVHTQEAIVITPTTEVVNNEEKAKVVKNGHIKL